MRTATVAEDLTAGQRRAILAASVGDDGAYLYLVPGTDENVITELIALGIAAPPCRRGFIPVSTR